MPPKMEPRAIMSEVWIHDAVECQQPEGRKRFPKCQITDSVTANATMAKGSRNKQATKIFALVNNVTNDESQSEYAEVVN
jgi:hypothetical protein